MMKKSQKHKGK